VQLGGYTYIIKNIFLVLKNVIEILPNFKKEQLFYFSMLKPINSILPLAITPEKLQSITDAVQALVHDLGPILLTLSPEERELIRQKEQSSTPLIEKIMNYMVDNPSFLNPETSQLAGQIDWKTIATLIPISNALNQLCNGLDDTLLQISIDLKTP
jgi:hypothetical protein